MKRICLLLICLFALATQASPQTGSYGGNSDYDIPRTPKDETLPPLPEAVAMRQYTDYPVALNTGAANVQIPVFSLDEGDIPLSVSLSYHSNGCKAEANSGAVGLGWTLQAGGCISRSIMGLPDEYKGIMVEDHTSTKLRLTHLTSVMQKRKDASMDRYYYNFNGYSGCFVRYGGHIIKLPENDLKIEEITGSDSKMPDFRIITPDGTAYYFTEKEYTSYEFRSKSYSNKPGEEYANYPASVTGWHLSKIVAPFGGDIVTFSYHTVPDWTKDVTEPGYSEGLEISKGGSNQGGTTVQASSKNYRIYDPNNIYHFHGQKLLQRISSRLATIDFSVEESPERADYPTRYRQITIKDPAGNLVRTCTLEHNLPTAPTNWTMLQGVSITASDGKTENRQTFEYYPAISYQKHQADVFGFNNCGARPGTGQGNYKPRGEYGESVLYKNLTLSPYKKFDLRSAMAGVLTKITDLTGAETTYEYEASTCGDSLLHAEASVGLRVKSIQVNDPLTGKTRVRSFAYANGTCSIDIKALAAKDFLATSGLRTQSTLSETLSWNATYTNSCRLPGGSLTNAVIYYGQVDEYLSGTDSEEKIRTTYNYDTSASQQQVIGACSFVRISNSFPENEKEVIIAPYMYPSSVQNNNEEKSRLSRIFQNNYVRGYIQETFWEKAPLKKKTIFKWNGTGYEQTEETTYWHTLDNETQLVTELAVPGKHVRDSVAQGIVYEGAKSPADLNYLSVTVNAARLRLDSVQVIRFFHNGQHEQEKRQMTRYKYNKKGVAPKDFPETVLSDSIRPANNQLLYSETTDYPDGTRLAHVYAYSANMTGLFYQNLSARGIIALPVMERWIINGKDTVQQWLGYKDFGDGNIRPYTQVTTTNGTPTDVRLYTRRDRYGNLLEGSDNYQAPTAYAYGYRHAYPVAVLQGAGYTTLGSEAELESVAAKTAPTQDDLDRLAQKRSLGGTLLWTYEHRPLVGMTKATGPSGRRHTYLYQGNRLWKELNHKGQALRQTDYAFRADGGAHNSVTTRVFTDTLGLAYAESVQYYDGLGLPWQRFDMGASTGGRNLASLTEHDALMRQTRAWLPVPTAGRTPLADPKGEARAQHDDSRPYTETEYEPAADGRPVASVRPGDDMDGRKATVEYLANTAGGKTACRRYDVLTDEKAVFYRGMWPEATLDVEKRTDENGHTDYTFTDSRGRTVLQRAIGDNGSQHDTYYLYDNLDRLCVVLPPSASSSFTNGFREFQTDSLLHWYAYLYIYDERGLCVEKKLPGAKPVYMRYDKTRTLVFTQDGNQRERGVWAFTLHDRMNRPTLQGEWATADVPDIEDMVLRTRQDVPASALELGGVLGTGHQLPGGTLDLPADGTVSLRTVNYYDDYSFRWLAGFGGLGAFDDNGRLGTDAKGLRTGGRYATDGLITRPCFDALFYDEEGRTVETRRTNHTGTGVDTELTSYSITGKPLARVRTHWTANQGMITERNYYSYDALDRPAEHRHKVRPDELVLAANTYDELGRLAKTVKPAETVTYGYDLQGRITAINGKLNQNLQYDYVGNIKALSWTKDYTYGKYLSGTWEYEYDALDRLTWAKVRMYPLPQVLGKNNREHWEYTYKGYDPNGNLTEVQLKQYLSTNGIPQTVTYDVREMYYNGNQLRAIARRDTPDKPMGVIRPTTCWYDGNGNLVKDLTRNISRIEYNPLNLPTEVTFGYEEGKVSYCYSSDGRKLRAVKSVDGKRVTNDYIGNVVYENGRSKLLLFDGGYFDCEDAGYHFYVKDYLGNNWAVVAEDGTVEEFNAYTPFGDLLYREGDAQPYKYNAKELEKELGWYDYGARFYHPQTMRFTTMDPLAEKYYAFSPYAYCGNNPVIRIDKEGKYWETGFDVLSLATGLASFRDNLREGNFLGALVDGVGIVADAVAIATPLPGGAGALINGYRAAKVAHQLQIHHIIPKSLMKNDVLKRAIQGGYSIEGKSNKIELPQFLRADGQGTHAKHSKYTTQIQERLKEANNKGEADTEEKAKQFMEEMDEYIRKIIEDNPDTKVNDLDLRLDEFVPSTREQ